MWRVTLVFLNNRSFWQRGVCCLSFKKIFHPAINCLSENCKTLGVFSHTSCIRLEGLLLSDSKDTTCYSQHDPSGVIDNGRVFRVLTLLDGRRGSMSLSDETKHVN
ncbi:hypothetical protein J3E71DRAFT_361118 [Bipolaris maydis]|nr:hypothetical protein J3E71DRAFT_361118 [Bipolaris maydis]